MTGYPHEAILRIGFFLAIFAAVALAVLMGRGWCI
jgi:hypothetical protein